MEIYRKTLMHKFVLVSIFLLFIFSRVYKIEIPIADWHSFRQVDTASVTSEYLKNGLNLLYPRYHDVSSTQSGLMNLSGFRFVEFPIFNVIHIGLVSLLPYFSFEVTGRLVSILAAFGSLLCIYFLAKRFSGESGALLASLFFTLMPFNIYFTRVILPEPLAVFFALIGLLAFVGYYDSNKLFPLYMSSVFFAFGILVKPYVLFYTIPAFYLIYLKNPDIVGILKQKKYYVWGLIIILPFILWRLWMRQFPEGIPFFAWTFNGDGIRFRPAFWRWLFAERIGNLMLGVWGIIPLALSLIAKGEGRNVIRSFFLGSFMYLAIIATANVRHDYYQTIIVPAVVLGVADGIIILWNLSAFHTILRKSLVLFCIFMMIVAPWVIIKDYYNINRPEIVEAGAALNKIAEKDALVIAPYNGDTAFLYETGHRGWPVVDRPIDELIEKGASYFVSVDLNHYQTLEFEKRFETLAKTDKYIILKLY